MRLSKYVNIDSNTLIEYLYDDGNLVGEAYNVTLNTKTNIKSFSSTSGSDSNNDLYNQLYQVDDFLSKYARISDTETNDLSGGVSFLQIRNFPTSIPIRYDVIKIHIPIDYTFGENKGFYLRVYTLDHDNINFIEISNYHFNITDVVQNYKMEYSSPALLINEKNWGKYLKIEIPSITKISDQRTNNITKENTINYNLSDGLGISKTSPIFIDFHYIESIDTINDIQIMNLGSRVTISFPQTPDFENLGVMVEKSTQGDFFLIFPTYNGSQGEFGIFLNESFYLGNRYYLEYQVDLYEKNILTKTQTFVVTEDFTEEIEYRPIIKFSTTTAAIDVTLRLIDSVDGTSITRKSSYGLIQDEVSKYSKNLTKIDLTKSNKQEVYNIKTTIIPNTSDNPFGTKPILTLDKLSFVLYSQEYNVIGLKESVNFNNKMWIGLNGINITISPFDNIIKFSILKNDELNSYVSYNLLDLRDINLTIKNDKKVFDFPIYRDSSENDLENGNVVFKISESKYQEIKKIYLSGNNIFYINGIDEFQNKIIIYSGLFLPYDISSNIQKLESEFLSSKSIIDIIPQSNKDDDKIRLIRTMKNPNIKGVTTNKPSSIPITQITKWNPFWKASTESIIYGYDKKNFKFPKDIREFTILLAKKKIIDAPQAFSISKNDTKINFIIGYFKGLNLNPDNGGLDFIYREDSPQKKDFLTYIDAGMSGLGNKRKYVQGISKSHTDVEIGELLPTDKRDYESLKGGSGKLFTPDKSNNKLK